MPHFTIRSAILGASLAMVVSSANAALLCSSPQEAGLSLCYMVSSCSVGEDGSASGGGYSLNPGRCVGAIAKESDGIKFEGKFAYTKSGKFEYTKSRREFENALRKAERKFEIGSK